MLHFSSVSDSDRMLEAGTIRARAITTRWNVFTSRRTQQQPPVLLALCCRARIWSLEMNFFFSAAWFKPLWWRWRIADHHYSFAIQGILICALLSGKEKKRSISDFIFERNQEAWRCLAAGGGSSRELPDLFFSFFFFALIFQTAGSQEVLALHFCIIMCNTVKQNKTGTKNCTFIMKHHTVQICGQAFGPGGCTSLTCQIKI